MASKDSPPASSKSSKSSTATTTTTTVPPNVGSVEESVIRKMTRLAQEHGAVNLSQGFPNEPPPPSVRLALALSVLTGQPFDPSNNPILPLVSTEGGGDGSKEDMEEMVSTITEEFARATRAMLHRQNDGNDDVLNQYSPPMGRPDLRRAISAYYQRLYDYEVSPDDITVTLGATEAVACALRSVGKPDDKVVIIEPFHELYPSQCRIFYLQPVFVTLRETTGTQSETGWKLDMNELEHALRDATILLLNTPHNPTGKVFSHAELRTIVTLCLRYNVTIVTDEIYEHMIYPDDKSHCILPREFPSCRQSVLMCNSIGKSASATGWRVGWCIHHSPSVVGPYRAVHDQLVVMAPHPMQYAAITYLAHLPTSYFTSTLRFRYIDRIRRLADTLQQIGFDIPTRPEGAYYLFVRFRRRHRRLAKSSGHDDDDNDDDDKNDDGGHEFVVKGLEGFQDDDPMEAVLHLLTDVGVAAVPGTNFYGKSKEDGMDYIRFAACRSMADVERACQRLLEWNHRQLNQQNS